MNKNAIFFLILFTSLISCNDKVLNLDTETYKVEINRLTSSHKGFSNTFQNNPLNVKAERLRLNEIFAILLKTDTSAIKFENKRLQNENYSLIIEQKDKNIPVYDAILKDMLVGLNLNLDTIMNKSVTNKSFMNKSFKLIIQDSLKYTNFINNSKNKESVVFNSKDSVKITNCDLKKVAGILSSEYSEIISFNGDSAKIDYAWKKISFEALKIKFMNDLGISFFRINDSKLMYSIRKN